MLFLVKLTELKHNIFFLFIAIFIFSCTENSSNNNQSLYNSNYTSLSNSKKIEYLDSIEKNIPSKNDSLKLKVLFEIAAEYYYLNKNESSFKTSKKIFKTSKSINDSISMGRALYYMGDCYESFLKDSAYYFYKESEKIFRLIKNDEKTAKALFNKAHLLFTEGNYIESEVEVIKALQKIKNSKNYELLYSCYYLQASNHTELEELEKALEYLDLALSNLEKVNSTSVNYNKYSEYKALVIVAICNIYDKKGDFNKSIEELEKIEINSLYRKNPLIFSTVTGNLAYANMKIGNYKKSLNYYNKSLDAIKSSEVDKNYLFKIINLGEYNLLVHDTINANKYFNEALFLSKKLKSGREVLRTLKFLSISDKGKDSFYKSEYVRISDSIVKKQRENREKFARIEYETDKVEEENKVLSNKNLILLLGLTITIVIFLTLLIIKNRIARKKEFNFIQQKELADQELLNITKEFQSELVKVKENEQNRISKELHDGIVNKIYGIRMILGSLNNNNDNESQKSRSEYLKELHNLEIEIRTLSHKLNSDFSQYAGEFNFLIEQLVSKNNEISMTNFTSEISPTINWNDYSSFIKINIYRILQELFFNVNKYANATNCKLTIYKIDSTLIIEVKDNGIGFDKNIESEGIGLKNIKERAKFINSKLIIDSKINKGTEVIIKTNC